MQPSQPCIHHNQSNTQPVNHVLHNTTQSRHHHNHAIITTAQPCILHNHTTAMQPHSNATTQLVNHATLQPQNNHATPQPHNNHATSQQRNHTTSQPCDLTTTQLRLLLRLLHLDRGVIFGQLRILQKHRASGRLLPTAPHKTWHRNCSAPSHLRRLCADLNDDAFVFFFYKYFPERRWIPSVC